MFTLKNVTIDLGGTPVLKDLSLDIREGERVVVLGINGCGKSTFLKALDGLVHPSAGELAYSGRPLSRAALDEPAFKRTFRKEVVLLFQQIDAMLFNPTVRDEIAFGPRQFGAGNVDALVDEWAAAFDVRELLDRAPFELSGGEKKRAALAALMAVGPRVLLLDEPTAHLDPAGTGRLVDFLAGLQETTIVTATHNLSIVEELGDRVLVIAKDHTLAYDGPAHDLFHDEALLIRSGLAHRHAHRHPGAAATTGASSTGSHATGVVHDHFHLHDME